MPEVQEQPTEASETNPNDSSPSTEPVTEEPVEPQSKPIGGQYDEIINSVRQLYAQQPPQQQPYQPPTQQVTMPAKPLDPDRILTDPDGWQQDLVGNMAGAMQNMQAQVSGPLYENLATSAKHLSRSDPKVAKIWEKYGDEIDALASSQAINPAIKGSKDFWDKAAKVVMSEHIDEITQERAQEIAASMGGGVETGAGGYGASSDDVAGMDKLRETAWGKKLLDNYGERGVMRNLEKMGKTVDQYVAMISDDNIVVNPNNKTEWWNRDLTRDVDNG